MAGSRRWRPARCISACLFDPDAGAARADPRDVAGLCAARRCVRISLGREAEPPLVGYRLFLRLDDCELRSGLCAGWFLAGRDREKQRVRRRTIRLADALLPVLRGLGCGRLLPLGRMLAKL